MQDVDALFEALGRSADPDAVRAIATLVREADDRDLARINALHLAQQHGLDEEKAIAALLHATRLGIVELCWNVLCTHCRGILDSSFSINQMRQAGYHCAFCAAESELTLDETVETSFTVSPRVRRIAAHMPDDLPFWDYFRQVFFSSGVAIPDSPAFDGLVETSMLDAVEVRPSERIILALQLPASDVTVFDPVTHRAQFLDIAGEPTRERQELTVVFDGGRSAVTRAALRPGPLRLTLDNRAETRVLAGVFVSGPDLERMFGRRRFLTAKRLLTNQTFRDLFRTETLDVDQGLKILSLTFLFTDLKGSTALYERVGDLVAYQLVRAHFRILNDIVSSEGGAVIKTIGDAVMATFATPDRAVSAALRMREAMGALNEERASRDVLLKIGLHEGPCLAVNLNDRQDFFGQTVNIASRVQALATADAILATGSMLEQPAVARLLASRKVEARSRIERLRGISQGVAVAELD